jgi:hypothetical protein
VTGEETRSDQRAETARRSDDSDIVDGAAEAPGNQASHQGRAGGNLQRDVATLAEERRVHDPEAREGVDKSDDIAHGQRSETRHPAEHVVTRGD